MNVVNCLSIMKYGIMINHAMSVTCSFCLSHDNSVKSATVTNLKSYMTEPCHILYVLLSACEY
jgi:hypothetical protein